jgi:hypothetical protein
VLEPSRQFDFAVEHARADECSGAVPLSPQTSGDRLDLHREDVAVLHHWKFVGWLAGQHAGVCRAGHRRGGHPLGEEAAPNSQRVEIRCRHRPAEDPEVIGAECVERDEHDRGT